VLRLLILIVVLVLCIGAQKVGERLYVLPSWEDLTAGPEGKTLALVLRGTGLEVLAEEGDWMKVQVIGWMPRVSVSADSLEPTRVSEDPIGVETMSKTFRRAVAMAHSLASPSTPTRTFETTRCTPDCHPPTSPHPPYSSTDFDGLRQMTTR
jgi:hypothetical protein